jgi:hypothetical protein
MSAAARKVAATPAPSPQAAPAAAPVQCRTPAGRPQLFGLRVSTPADAAEREAESTATQIMRPGAPAPSVAPVLGRGGVARQAERPTNVPKPPAIVPSLGAPGGAPLPPAVRRFMEPRFRADLGGVRVHTDDRAAGAAKQLNARAFTVGPNVFFGRDQFRPEQEEGKRLLAHELTHTIQQGAVIQDRGGDTVRERPGPVVQRFGIGDALDKIAEYANNIPGFRMFTIVLGVNPVNMSRVERSAANIMRAVIEFIPGGGFITQALDNHGVFDKVAGWVDQQLQTLGMVGASIKQALSEFLKSLSWTDIFDLGDVWRRAKRIFTDPIDRIISFVKGLAAGILKLIKDAILRPLAKLAEGTQGYDLLRAVLGQDPVTGDPYPRTPETLIGGFMKLIGQEEVWNNVKKANAIPRAWAWFQGAVTGLLGFVRRIPSVFIEAFTSLTIEDIILVPRALFKVGKVFAGFVGEFISWGLNAVWTLLEIIFAVVAPGVLEYLKKAGAAFRTILNNPIGFVGNLVRAAKLGFQQFADNIGKHLKTALIEWLTGSLAGAGVYIPQAFEIRELIKFVLSVLGLTWANIRQKLVRVLGETAVKVLETGFDIVVVLVTQGPAAAWEKIQESLTNLKEIVIEQITSFVTSKIVQIAVTKLLSLLNPAGAIIQAIIAIYNTIMFFVERLRQIGRVVGAFIDSISAIAAGVIASAANRVETTLAGVLSLAISFLARLVGLGKVSDAIVGVINKVRAPIDKALDRVVAWIVSMAKKLGKILVATAQRVLAWWLTKVSFRAGEESHTLSFQGEATAATLVVASAARPIEQFLAEKRPEAKGNAAKQKAIDAITAQLKYVKPLIRESEKREGDEALQKKIEAAMKAMAGHLMLLLSETEWGTSANPVPLEYEKRRAAAYPVFYLAVGSDLIGLDKAELQKRHAQKEYRGRIFRYAPTSSQATPGGEETLGLGAGSQVEVGRKIEFDKEGKRDAGVRNFKNVVKKYGYKPGPLGLDVDHVVELQIGGQDVISNLWPLPAGENRSSGALLKAAKTKLPGDKIVAVADAHQRKKKENQRLWMIVTSTRQR